MESGGYEVRLVVLFVILDDRLRRGVAKENTTKRTRELLFAEE
jgi:hypothetical protein